MNEENVKKEFNKEYIDLISMILKAIFSKTEKDLDNIVNGEFFKKFVSDKLGFETASFYFYDENEKRLMFFHEAIENGINMPFYKITQRNNDGSFKSTEVQKEEFERRRNKQREFLMKGSEPITATLCYNNITSKTPRWSQSERDYERILIPEGEILVFSFEYILRNYLKKIGCETKKEAQKKIETSYIAKQCWMSLHSKTKYRNMRMREEESYFKLIEWLKDVMSNQYEYSYLWNSKSEMKNWFIKAGDKVKHLIEKYEHKEFNYDLIKEIASLIVKYTYSDSNNGKIVLKSTKFYQRSRLSPQMELFHGTHNIVVFMIQQYLPENLVKTDFPINAFLLGTFYNKESYLCNYEEIKNIYSLIATRDLIRFSMKKLAGIIRKIEETEKFMSKLNDYIYAHGLKSPLTTIRNNVELLEEKDVKEKDFSKIFERLATIRNQTRKIDALIDAANKITLVAHLSKKISIPIISFLENLLLIYKKEIIIPNNIKIIQDYPDHEVNVQISDEESFKIIIENLIINSVEAINGKKNGRIVIKVREDSAVINLSIVDNGGGISPEILPIVFAPFKSTKKNGQKRGLGLYICRNLVELQGGKIKADNLDGGWALFNIELNKS